MYIKEINPPRIFAVGKKSDILLNHVATISLQNNEIVTFLGENNREYEITSKEWGFYATPSLNSRLKQSRICSCLVRSQEGKLFIHLVYSEKRYQHELYCESENLEIIEWFYIENE